MVIIVNHFVLISGMMIVRVGDGARTSEQLKCVEFILLWLMQYRTIYVFRCLLSC